jgi:aspartate/glutamate racemase
MKVAGIIGGTSWHSTVDMYRYVNQKVSDTLGGYHNARVMICNVDLQDILDQNTPAGKAACWWRRRNASRPAALTFS